MNHKPVNRKIQGPIFLANVCVSLLISVNAEAGMSQSEVEKITAKWKCQWCPYEEVPHKKGEVEAGVGSVSNDSFKYGQYTGMNEKGAYLVGNGSYEYKDKDANYADVKVRDIGPNALQLEAKGGSQGTYDVELQYAELPSLNLDTTRTPYQGREVQTLPVGWVAGPTTGDMTELTNSLRDVDIYTERKTIDLGATYHVSPSLSFDLNYQHQKKKGNKTMGLALGNTFATAWSAILAVPVDTSTELGEIKVHYRTRQWQASLGYEFSRFDNEHESVQWENAYSNPSSTFTGQAALEPDNKMQQITFDGAYSFSADTRAMISIATGRMQQDADFLPYTINGSLTPLQLPRASLDGEINTFNTTWRINTRWDDEWGFTAQYRQNEQDNDTPRETYDYVIADTALSSTARANFPYSFREREILLQGRYQIGKQRHINLDYEHTMNDRTYQEVESSDEDTLSATYRSSVNEYLQWFLRLETSDREGDEYTPVTEISPPENPLLRKYNLADRQRNLVKVFLSSSFSDALQLSAYADYADDDYSDSRIGLQESQQSTYSLELQYRVSASLSMNFDYSVTDMDSMQAGVSWKADNEDSIDVAHIGVNYAVMKNKLLLGADFTFSEGVGDIAVSTGSGFPSLKNTRQTIELFADYSLDEKSVIHIFLGYEDYKEDDWAINGVVPNTLDTVLTLGEVSPSYGIGTFAISYIRKF